MQNIKLIKTAIFLGIWGIWGMWGAFEKISADELAIAPKGVDAVPNLGSFISAGLGAIFLIAFLIFLAMLIWGGIQWITSGGDKENTQKARDRITSALVGVAIVASAWAATKAVEWFFGINILGEIQLPSARDTESNSTPIRTNPTPIRTNPVPY